MDLVVGVTIPGLVSGFDPVTGGAKQLSPFNVGYPLGMAISDPAKMKIYLAALNPNVHGQNFWFEYDIRKKQGSNVAVIEGYHSYDNTNQCPY